MRYIIINMHLFVPMLLQMLQEASEMEREKQLSMAPVNIAPFLTPVGVWETKWIRRLSHLSALTYRPARVNVGARIFPKGLLDTTYSTLVPDLKHFQYKIGPDDLLHLLHFSLV